MFLQNHHFCVFCYCIFVILLNFCRLALPTGRYLQSSVPLSVLAEGAVNGMDIFDVSLSEHGVPVSLYSLFLQFLLQIRVFLNKFVS